MDSYREALISEWKLLITKLFAVTFQVFSSVDFAKYYFLDFLFKADAVQAKMFSLCGHFWYCFLLRIL